MIDVPDHPAIQNAERTGWPDGKEPTLPICPCCGSVCETIYMDAPTGIIHGCDVCVTIKDAWEVTDCFPEE